MTWRSQRLLSAILLAASVGRIVHAQCTAPPPPVIDSGFARDVSVGQSYAVGWTPSAGADTWYIAERSTSPSFDKDVEVQYTGALAGSFLSRSEGTYFHRVRAVAACDDALASTPSPLRTLNVVRGKPLVVIAAQPQPVFADLSESLDGKRGSFSLENRGSAEVMVRLTRREISSPPFFRITDSAGTEIDAVTLPAAASRILEIRFGGPPTGARGSYQGLIEVSGATEELTATAYAYVSLIVGGPATDGTPVIKFNGAPTDSVAFPGFPAGQPDGGRPPLQLEISNPGTAPMELGAEIGPELWVAPAPGWNAQPVPPGSSVRVDLLSSRERVRSTAAFPRYTYITFRTRSGASARVAVQDSDRVPAVPAAVPPLAAGKRSFLLPAVARLRSAVGEFKTRVRLANVSNVPIHADLYFVPIQESQSSAMRSSVIVPPNDVVSSSDILVDLFGLDVSVPRLGVLEVRSSAENSDFLVPSATTYAQYSFGESAFDLPVILSGEGAREGAPHSVSGVIQTPLVRSNFFLVETSRNAPGPSVAVLTLRDSNGSMIGTAQLSLRPGEYFHGNIRIVFPAAANLQGGRLELSVDGPGTIAVVLQLVDNETAQALPAYVGGPLPQNPRGKTDRVATRAAAVTKSYVVVGVKNGPEPGLNLNYATALGITALDSPAEAAVTLLDARSKGTLNTLVRIPANQNMEFRNVLAELFGIGPGVVFNGTLTVRTSSAVRLYGRVFSTGPGPEQILGNLPVIGDNAETMTGAAPGLQRPVYFDGLEQSTDPTRGSRWTLSLTELNSRPATVIVRLYEPGNREAPIAEREITVSGRDHKILDTVFAELGLDEPERRKDRTNVQVVVAPKNGSGLVTAVATGFDVRTGTTTRYVLTPNGGIPATGVSKVTANPLGDVGRRRTVGR